MTLDEAILHAKEVASEQERLMGRYDAASGYTRSGNEAIRTESAKECEKCAAEHRQLAEWLHELKERRKGLGIVRCGECVNQYKPTCPFGVWINTPDDGHCHWAERRTDD